MSLMKGRVFEKVGVNVTTVHGRFSPEFARTIPGAEADPRFWASGISLVAHMQSPHVPAVHMNTRHIVTTQGWVRRRRRPHPDVPPPRRTRATSTPRCGRPATPTTPAITRASSNGATSTSISRIAASRAARAASSTTGSRAATGRADFAFTRDVGLAFLDIYPQIVRRRMSKPWTEAEREHQLVRRGRYVEFNLLYDRGTQFGLKTGGNTEAILMSLPPEARWP